MAQWLCGTVRLAELYVVRRVACKLHRLKGVLRVLVASVRVDVPLEHSAARWLSDADTLPPRRKPPHKGTQQQQQGEPGREGSHDSFAAQTIEGTRLPVAILESLPTAAAAVAQWRFRPHAAAVARPAVALPDGVAPDVFHVSVHGLALRRLRHAVHRKDGRVDAHSGRRLERDELQPSQLVLLRLGESLRLATELMRVCAAWAA
eukprot:CAMPEP_0181247366 /NCGR_PEP_ID=MMETSP1096-20121128/44570_1 /TAXON_ID=156174 ORGANISM="Chrysochromulina ericina, Strain CCMP281" /NCGR_SAMPLE_ID=MMETSP1096 /ASSEMBLY_ACC=CAM_ASM_000453 /LENGTH=204 /DNA_ID=CAMNT_0023344407 /DNA_START=252 /DNA_END=864 /DNA_ORIENTATION=-